MTNEQLRIEACKIRRSVIEMTHAAKSGHPGGSLSIAEAMAFLYFSEMNINPLNPDWERRDRFVLSKGHAVPALYAALAQRGFFPTEHLMTLRRIGSDLQGHPNIKTPGVDMSTGSLGQGISAACGMAKAAKMTGSGVRVYCIVGDGECQEGQVWEAIHFAAHYKLDNLCILIDWNNLQIDGRVDDVMKLGRLDDRLRASNCNVRVIDGHDFDQIRGAFSSFHGTKDRPTIITLQTVKGRGVSFMEDQAGWHGKAPNDMEHARAMAELNEQMEALKQ